MEMISGRIENDTTPTGHGPDLGLAFEADMRALCPAAPSASIEHAATAA